MATAPVTAVEVIVAPVMASMSCTVMLSSLPINDSRKLTPRLEALAAEMLGKDYDEELHRVIIHGILHLCGQNDKGPGEREQMEAAEDRALALR